MWKLLSKKYGLPVLLGVFLLFVQQAYAAENLESLLKLSSQGGKYVPASQQEVVQAETLFGQTLQHPADQKLVKAWQAIGFDMLQITDAGAAFVVLRESEARREGRGFYVIRTGKTDSTLLQAPHSFKDEHTREIVLKLMLQSHVAAAVWNTVPRRYEEQGVQVDADMAHLNQTYFIAFSRAFGRWNKQGHIVQIHGFASEKRKSSAGEQADMVLSSGTAYPADALLGMAGCLKRQLTRKALVYPVEVRELGGTTNSIGDALRQIGYTGFMHVEMSAAMRQQALKDASFITRFVGCLPQ